MIRTTEDVPLILTTKFAAFYSETRQVIDYSIDDFYEALQNDSNDNYRYKWVTKEMIAEGLDKLYSFGFLGKRNDGKYKWMTILA